MDAADGGFLEARMVQIAFRHALCARLFSVRLVHTYFLTPDRYKRAINTTKGAVFFVALSPHRDRKSARGMRERR